MLVRQILLAKGSAGVSTIAPGDDIVAATRLMARHRIGALVVAESDRRIAGILSERDIVRELASRGPALLDLPVAEIMTRAIVTCRPDQTADELLAIMTEGRFRHLPVIEEGEMVGLLSIGDVVKARLDELAMENSSLEGMIMGY